MEKYIGENFLAFDTVSFLGTTCLNETRESASCQFELIIEELAENGTPLALKKTGAKGSRVRTTR